MFLYGPEADVERMSRRCVSARGPRRATLPGWSLRFDRVAVERDGTGEPNVVPDAQGRVEGALYVVDRVDLQRLDPAMGHPRRTSRRLLRVVGAEGGRVGAWVYVATPEWRADGLQPRREDIAAMLALESVFSAETRAALLRSLGADAAATPR